MKHGEARFLSCMYVLSLTLLAVFAIHGLTNSVSVSGNAVPDFVIVLDAGHGGTDGGSSSPNGIRECDINLEVTLRTDAVFGLLGKKTKLVRSTDTDLADANASTISQKKVTDIHNRVALTNADPNSILVSIHQNTYPDKACHGAQVFYGKEEGSSELADLLQENLRSGVDPENKRLAKPISPDIYLMNHVTVPGVLVECGFLTNPTEEAKLQTADYQKRLAVTIAASVSNFCPEKGSGV